MSVIGGDEVKVNPAVAFNELDKPIPALKDDINLDIHPPTEELQKSDGRDTWSQKMDFLLSIIGFAIDLANVWRFPYLCYKNGGGAFLVPYFLMFIFGGMPLLLMELTIGQYFRQGPITVWKLCPILMGVGYGSMMVSFYVSWYYNAVIGWGFYYMFSSMTSQLPWTQCDNSWNTIYCWDSSYADNETLYFQDITINATNGQSPAEEFYVRGALHMHESTGFDDIGGLQWPIVSCILLVFIILFLTLMKGIKVSGKVIWVTAILPYVVLVILLVRGLLLPGSITGIKYYLIPDFTLLRNAQVWVDAAQQIFYSMGGGFGVLIALSSYNKFDNNFYSDAIITSCVNAFTSLLSGFVIFATLGYMAFSKNENIEDVATAGPGLIFVVYPEAISQLPGAPVWSILFFVMVISLGIDSSLGAFECMFTGVIDRLPKLLKSRRVPFVAISMLVVFLINLPNATAGGSYVINWFERYAAGTSLIMVAFFEIVTVFWFYGCESFCDNFEEMLGFRPNIWWRICWKYISPVFILFVLIMSAMSDDGLTLDEYVYPKWSNSLGLFSVITVLVCLFGTLCYQLLTTKAGSIKEKLVLSITPEWEQIPLRRKGYLTSKRLKPWHWFNIG